MTSQPDRAADQRLLDGIKAYVSGLRHPDLDDFRDDIMRAGNEWVPVEPENGPASDLMVSSLAYTTTTTHGIAALFAGERTTCKWEQTYKPSDNAALNAMLDSYGFAEVIGKWGPFVSDQSRVGMALWGPNVVYPQHRHKADEIYIIVAGSAEFSVGEGTGSWTEIRRAGDIVRISSNSLHGFTTADEPLAILAVWQAAPEDLRTSSTFN